jgi:hypothetical protein
MMMLHVLLFVVVKHIDVTTVILIILEPQQVSNINANKIMILAINAA